MQAASCRALARVVAPVAASRSRKANWTVEPCAVKRRRVQESWRQAAPRPQLRPQSQQAAFAAAAAGAPSETLPEAPPEASTDPPVSITFCVPECRLQPGEHVRVVGSCQELGQWHVDAALPLDWKEGDAWTAQLSLPPGRHEFKLVVLRERDGSVQWEEGPNRELPLQQLAGLGGAADEQPAVTVTCAWGDPAATTPAPATSQGQLQAAAQAAEARVAALRQQRRQLAERAARLEREVQQCEAAINEREEILRKLVAGEQRRLEQAAELGGAATVVPDAAAAAAAAPAAASGRDAPAAGGKAMAAGKAAVKPGRAAAELQQAGSRRQPGSTVSHLATASLESEEAIEDTAQLQLKHTQEAATPAGQHAAPAQPELAGTQEEASGQAGGSDDARGGQADGATAMCMDVDEKEAGEGSSAGSTAAKAATTEPPAAAQQQAKTPPANKAGERQAAAHAQRESGGGQDAAAAAGGAQEQGPPTAAKPLAATATSSALPAASPEARKAAAGGGASLDGALVEAAPDGTLSFRFDVAPSSGAAGGGPGQRSAADLARERLLGRLPPGAAQGLQQRLERMSLGAGGSEAAGEAPAGRPSPLGTLSPSTRGGSAPLGNTPRPAAASSGDWQPPRPPPRKPRQRQLRAGDVSLPRPADEPPPAADAAAAAEREPAPLAPPPPPAADQAELLHLFSSPAAAQPLPGQGRSQAGAYTGVATRGSLPAAAIWLTLAAVFSLGGAAWEVGRTALPPAARRPADVAFWLLLSWAVAAPFWQ